MALGKNIKMFREAKGWKQEELSERTNFTVSQGAISALEKRDSKSSEFTAAIAKALEISIEQLMNPSDETYVYKSSDGYEVNQTLVNYSKEIFDTKPIIGRCPVISWVKAGELCESGHAYTHEDADEWRDCPVKHSSKTYVLVIVGDSMYPEYLEGWDIFVDPDIQPEHNDDVIVRDETGKATFKRLQITPEGKYLLALNPEHPQRKIVVPENSTICGVVIYSGKKRR